MFESILLFEKKSSRAGPMAIAVTLEIAIIVTLVTAPMFFKTDKLSEFILVDQVFSPPQAPPGPKVVSDVKKSSPAPKKKAPSKETDIPPATEEILQSPSVIPQDIVVIEDNTGNKGEPEKGEAEGTGSGAGVPGGKPCDAPNCVPGGAGEPEEKEKEPSPPPPDPPRVGGNVQQAKLIHKVEPIYPPLARQNGVQGNVVLEAIIGADGATHNIKVVSGHTLLRQSAVNAIEQWKYEPATLNGKPIEVETTITVKYVLK